MSAVDPLQMAAARLGHAISLYPESGSIVPSARDWMVMISDQWHGQRPEAWLGRPIRWFGAAGDPLPPSCTEAGIARRRIRRPSLAHRKLDREVLAALRSWHDHAHTYVIRNICASSRASRGLVAEGDIQVEEVRRSLRRLERAGIVRLVRAHEFRSQLAWLPRDGAWGAVTEGAYFGCRLASPEEIEAARAQLRLANEMARKAARLLGIKPHPRIVALRAALAERRKVAEDDAEQGPHLGA